MENPPLNLEEKLATKDPQVILPLLRFRVNDPTELIVFKFNIFARYFFPKYFKAPDAPFHALIDEYLVEAYKGTIGSFTDMAFRGATKTTRTKLFVAFAIANDEGHFRRYIRLLAEDPANAKQFVTDVYNMFVVLEMKRFYPEVFERTLAKREETMGSFTTSTGIKVIARSVGTDQRGNIQDENRPDFDIYDDFETRKTLRSAVMTKAIWDNMEEARTGLAKNGASVYNCNYLSERGNVHKLYANSSDWNVVLIVPIKDKLTGASKWPGYYTVEDIKRIEEAADDFAGEYMNEPSLGADVFVDRETLNKQTPLAPLRIMNGLKIFYEFDPSDAYGGGMDIAGGVGLDSSTSVFMDFTTFPARVVGTYHNNEIMPTTFGDEIKREAEFWGKPIVAPENNKFDSAIGRLRDIYDNIYWRDKNPDQAKMKRRVPDSEREYGYNTNSATKYTCDMEFAMAIEKGHVELNDPDLIAEAKSYTRDDAMDREVDPRLTTRHFDLWRAAAICWQMRTYAKTWTNPKDSGPAEHEEAPRYSDIGI